jgi:hypothetical protein
MLPTGAKESTANFIGMADASATGDEWLRFFLAIATARQQAKAK